MNKTRETQILVAGFGGQGILFTGKLLAYAGMIAGHEVSWLPSYGPEMRGGTANCSVIISELPVGSPIIINPNVLITMNQPSLEKFEDDVLADGIIFVDNSLIKREVRRGDVECVYIPAAKLADEHELKGLASMVMIGQMIRRTEICGMENIRAAMGKVVPERKAKLLEANLRAIDIGFEYE